jgi:hypothetical protein
MTFRSSLVLAGVTWVALAAACSSPSDDGPNSGPPAPPGGLGQGGSAGSGAIGAGNGGTGQQGIGGSGTGLGAGGTGTALGQGGGTGLGMGGTGAVVGGSGLDIKPNADGFVSGTTNGLGIQGAFYTASDAAGTPPGTSTITPANFVGAVNATTGEICVSGSGAAIAETPTSTPAMPDYLYSQYWGAVVGLNLSQPNDPVTGMPSMVAQPWNPVTPAGTVSGFSFTITGTGIPAGADLRFKTTFPGMVAGTEYCVPFSTLVPAGNVYTVAVTQQTANCWTGTGAPFTPGPLLSLQWQIVTKPIMATPFNFCIGNLKAVIGPG